MKPCFSFTRIPLKHTKKLDILTRHEIFHNWPQGRLEMTMWVAALRNNLKARPHHSRHNEQLQLSHQWLGLREVQNMTINL